MPWVTRWLREGVLTTRYPARRDDYGAHFRATVTLQTPREQLTAGRARPGPTLAEVAARCPTSAIGEDGAVLSLDRGRCIGCGRCVASRPDVFRFSPELEGAEVAREALVVATSEAPTTEDVEGAMRALHARTRALRRSIHVRHVDAGSDGSEEWEIKALWNPVYDVQRLGIFLTASPRHADVLLVTGAGASGMAGPLRRTYEAMPEPKVVVAVGTEAISGGLVASSYATRGGVGSLVPVDVWVPGSPPSPFAILHGMIRAVDLVVGR